MQFSQAVQDAQKYLNALGATDGNGRLLVEDGIWGPNVSAAFAKIYAAHGMSQPSSLTAAVLTQLRAWFNAEPPKLTVTTSGPRPDSDRDSPGPGAGAAVLIGLLALAVVVYANTRGEE